MSAPSPVDQYGNKPSGSGYGSSDKSDSGKSPLSMSLGFLKNLTERKPNRGITHRERKELYIKALEQEVLHLKEKYTMVSRSKDSLAEENRQLKQLLAQHGIPWTGTGGVDELALQAPTNYTSSGSISGSYAPGSQSYSPPPLTHSSNSNPQSSNQSPPVSNNDPTNDHRSMAQQQLQPSVDYDQAGIDFVLTLERPCMDHLDLLVSLSNTDGGPMCGHSLMASCPPAIQIEPAMPFGHGPRQNAGAQKTWDLSKTDLANLLDLSKRLDLDGEITPVMAWGMILGHPRFGELRGEHFVQIAQELGGKIRCYGFGAVLEEFEVRDALANVFHDQSDVPMMY
ncbi:hypothetical protein HYFRA_00003099 [Hymenoscyphus fraxineus]|uniref:BZIP-type transcription factor n=1 Tax=Hymenoscyphus fraxineus TaxID=746836 RepID=A0A9N9KRU1_9HELO|nr:hypothetical protein HYFRA_00003099 [Hymenoscyphus fraxineus]